MFVLKKLTIYHDKTPLVDLSFSIKHSLALVGQSGSGKSLTLKALLDLLPKDLTKEMEVEWEYPLVRGKSVALVPQNPFTALSPLTLIKDQFFSEDAADLMELVGLEKDFLDRYPPQLSGGQLQRVIIAMALSHKPKLLLLDEPTTALDPHTKEMIIKLILQLQEQFGFLILFVSHDIASAKALCKEVTVIKSGRIVESGSMQEVLQNPKERYTKELIESNFAMRAFRQ